jgi:hypothetical protein
MKLFFSEHEFMSGFAICEKQKLIRNHGWEEKEKQGRRSF